MIASRVSDRMDSRLNPPLFNSPSPNCKYSCNFRERATCASVSFRTTELRMRLSLPSGAPGNR
ncbi:MAG: hypothetical protein MAG794_01000 [Gammaproteobacteria bacterium]|nr:hypothetical protein [Gammaproteobacteria bacterium]